MIQTTNLSLHTKRSDLDEHKETKKSNKTRKEAKEAKKREQINERINNNRTQQEDQTKKGVIEKDTKRGDKKVLLTKTNTQKAQKQNIYIHCFCEVKR